MKRIIGAAVLAVLAVGIATPAHAASGTPTVKVAGGLYGKGETVYPNVISHGSLLFGQKTALLRDGKVVDRGDYSVTPRRGGIYKVRTTVEYAVEDHGNVGQNRYVTAVSTIRVSTNATPTCMTRKEFSQVKVGMRLPKVARIVGSKGHVALGSKYLTVRQWDNCANEYGVGSLGFSGGKVQSKVFL